MKAYKSYIGAVEFDEDDLVFHGRIDGIHDIVTFEAEAAAELVKAFHESVDDYLAYCAERGRQPEKPYSGKLALRMKPDVHARADQAARRSGKSLNQWIADTVAEAADKRNAERSIHILAR